MHYLVWVPECEFHMLNVVFFKTYLGLAKVQYVEFWITIGLCCSGAETQSGIQCLLVNSLSKNKSWSCLPDLHSAKNLM